MLAYSHTTPASPDNVLDPSLISQLIPTRNGGQGNSIAVAIRSLDPTLQMFVGRDQEVAPTIAVLAIFNRQYGTRIPR